MQRNKNIEILRAVACVMIVFVHARFPGPLGIYVVSFARIGVPIFLMISGFFFYDSREKMKKKAEYQLKKTIKWTVFSLCICILSNSIFQLISGNPPFYWLAVLKDSRLWIHFLLFNRAYWLCSVMYYFFMIIYVYLIMMIALRSNINERAFLLIPALLICNIAVSETGHHSWYYVGNYLFTGIPFFLLGMYLKKTYRIQNNKVLIVAALLGAGLTVIETAIFGEAYLYVGTILMSVSLFYLCINNRSISHMRLLAWFGTECSVFVFVIHCHVMDYITLWTDRSFAEPILVIVISAILAITMAVFRKELKRLRTE